MMYRSHIVLGLLTLWVGISHTAQAQMYFDDEEGSADGLDSREHHPYKFPTDDEFSGDSYSDLASGDGGYIGEGAMTDCQKLNVKMMEKERKGLDYDFMPRCDDDGSFRAMQCNTFGNCWCVNYNGQEMSDTRRSAPRQPNCSKLDRNTIYTTDTWDIDNPVDEKPIIKEDRTGTENGKFTDDDDEKSTDDDSDQDSDDNDVFRPHSEPTQRVGFLAQPLILAGIIAFAVVCLLCAVLLVMFIVYRMRKKDEGSYALDEPKRSPSHPYQRAPTKEYFA